MIGLDWPVFEWYRLFVLAEMRERVYVDFRSFLPFWPLHYFTPSFNLMPSWGGRDSHLLHSNTAVMLRLICIIRFALLFYVLVLCNCSGGSLIDGGWRVR